MKARPGYLFPMRAGLCFLEAVRWWWWWWCCCCYWYCCRRYFCRYFAAAAAAGTTAAAAAGSLGRWFNGRCGACALAGCCCYGSGGWVSPARAAAARAAAAAAGDLEVFGSKPWPSACKRRRCGAFACPC